MMNGLVSLSQQVQILFRFYGNNTIPNLKFFILAAGSSKNQEMHNMNMEAIVKDDMVCLLCLQIPKEWFIIESCGCRFCLPVSLHIVLSL